MVVSAQTGEEVRRIKGDSRVLCFVVDKTKEWVVASYLNLQVKIWNNRTVRISHLNSEKFFSLFKTSNRELAFALGNRMKAP